MFFADVEGKKNLLDSSDKVCRQPVHFQDKTKNTRQ